MSSIQAVQHFVPDLDQVRWQASGDRLMCTLAYHVPDFGDVYVRHPHAEHPRTLVYSWQTIPQHTSAWLFQMKPAWQHDPVGYRIARGQWQHHQGRSLLTLSTADTMKLLGYLQLGHQVRVKYQNHARLDVRVDVLPVHFSKAYQRYIACSRQLLSFKFATVSDSTFYFDPDSLALSTQALQQLERIADYIKADRRVVKVLINGYTDHDGSRAHNIFLSERRAKRVAAYLTARGIDKKLLKLNWHGSRYPAVVDDTTKGRAKNRRVRIQLIR